MRLWWADGVWCGSQSIIHIYIEGRFLGVRRYMNRLNDVQYNRTKALALMGERERERRRYSTGVMGWELFGFLAKPMYIMRSISFSSVWCWFVWCFRYKRSERGALSAYGFRVRLMAAGSSGRSDCGMVQGHMLRETTCVCRVHPVKFVFVGLWCIQWILLKVGQWCVLGLCIVNEMVLNG